MVLSEKDVTLFYKLYNQLRFYANQKIGIISRDLFSLPEKAFECKPEQLNNIRKKLFMTKTIILTYVDENPYALTTEELAIVRSWEHFIAGDFFVFRYLKKYTILISEEKTAKAYGVLGLQNTFEELIGPHLPITVKTILLPFRDSIVTDGLLESYPVFFGGNITASLNDTYNKAKAMFGIIEQLPFDQGKVKSQSEADMLKYYLKTKGNREYYQEEIVELIGKNRSLLKLYHEEMGKIDARWYKKNLAHISFNTSPVWFALLRGTTIASGKSKQEVQSLVEELTDKKEHDLIYYFQFKRK
jgi:hypothetical protein